MGPAGDLLHVDTRQDYLSILSVTRDLWVHIPGYGDDRINAAYHVGGPALTIATLKQNLGIDITTYVGVGFEKFPSLIDSLGGVTYTVCGTLGKPDHVWWVKGGVLYWVSNTIMYMLGDQDLLQIAEAMQPVS